MGAESFSRFFKFKQVLADASSKFGLKVKTLSYTDFPSGKVGTPALFLSFSLSTPIVNALLSIG